MSNFNAVQYLTTLLPHNKLFKAKDFKIHTAPSISDLADADYDSRENPNQFVIIDTSTTTTTVTRSGSYVDEKQYTCFLLMRYEVGNEADRRAKRDICEKLKQQIHSKMVLDADAYSENGLDYFDVQRIMAQEMPDFRMNGMTGIWFVFSVVTPADRRITSSEWD